MVDSKAGIRKILHHSTCSPDRAYRSDVCKTALLAVVGYFHRWGMTGLLRDMTAWRPLLLWALHCPFGSQGDTMPSLSRKITLGRSVFWLAAVFTPSIHHWARSRLTYDIFRWMPEHHIMLIKLLERKFDPGADARGSRWRFSLEKIMYATS